MSLNTYLTFNDNCREVFEFYRSVFGSEFDTIVTFREGPPDMGIAEAEQDRIMHVSLPIGSSILMGSDSCSAFGPPPITGSNFSISFSAETRNDAPESRFASSRTMCAADPIEAVTSGSPAPAFTSATN